MSAKIAGLVWDLYLPREEKYVLLCLADHADHEGRNVYPSIGRIAWKTGYSERRVQELMRKLEERGLLVKVGHRFGGRGRTCEYQIEVNAGTMREPYKKGAKISPLLNVNGEISQGPKGEMNRVNGAADREKGCWRPHPNPKEPSQSKSLNGSKCSRCGGTGLRASISKPGKTVVCECQDQHSGGPL